MVVEAFWVEGEGGLNFIYESFGALRICDHFKSLVNLDYARYKQ